MTEDSDHYHKGSKRSMKYVSTPEPPDAQSAFIPLSQGKFSLVDRADFERLNQWNWSAINAKHTYYAMRGVRVPGKHYRGQVLMHREIMKPPEGYEVDHINGDGLDNRRSNLRIVTKAENLRNRGTFRNSKSGYKGVKFNSVNGRWLATLNIGTFDSAEEAARAYDKVIRRLFGSLAKTNFPDGDES